MADDTRELLEKAARGEQHAWDKLVERHNGLLWGIARGYRLGDADTADAVQTAWLRLVEHIDTVKEPERLAGWLATTVRRECLRLLRKRGPESPAGAEIGADIVVDEPLDASLLIEERDAALWRALQKLSERCQRLLRVLMATPPPTYAAVADALDIPIGSIGPSRQRCLEQLRRITTRDTGLDLG